LWVEINIVELLEEVGEEEKEVDSWEEYGDVEKRLRAFEVHIAFYSDESIVYPKTLEKK
jgi:hypothetical protein